MTTVNRQKVIKIKDKVYLKYFKKKNRIKINLLKKTSMRMRRSINFQKMMNKAMKL